MKQSEHRHTEEDNTEKSKVAELTMEKADARFVSFLQKCFMRGSKGEKKGSASTKKSSQLNTVYDALDSFLVGNNIPSSLKYGFAYWVVGLLLFFVFSLSLLITIANNFSQFNETLDLVSIQNEFILPVDFITTLTLLTTTYSTFISSVDPNIKSIIHSAADFSISKFKLAYNHVRKSCWMRELHFNPV